MRRRGRSGIPFIAAGTVAVVLAAAAAAYALTRTPAPAHRAAIASSSASAVQYAATAAVRRAKVALAPAKPVVPAAVATPPVAVKPPAETKPRQQPLAFDSARAMAHVRKLANDIGVRPGGSGAEWRAMVYARDYLRSLGYEVTVTEVKMDNGKITHDVVAKRKGAAGPIVVLGGHIDTKDPAPGADDNATGVGTVLELARDFAGTEPKADLRFVAFGCEELIGDGNSDHHHYGSRAYVRSLTSRERERFAAMISIDMIGYGEDFRVRTMGVGTRLLADKLLATARGMGAPLAYLRDPGSSGWSDHEPFEKAGLPSAWLEWRDDPNAHTSKDTASRLNEGKVRTTGRLVNSWLRGLTDAQLEELVRS